MLGTPVRAEVSAGAVKVFRWPANLPSLTVRTVRSEYSRFARGWNLDVRSSYGAWVTGSALFPTDCDTADVGFDVLFTGVPVSDFNTSHAWYESFFGRPADIVAHELEVMWKVTDGGWLYILHDPDHAGNSIVAMAVADIEQAISALHSRGVATGPIKPEGDAGRKAVALDPDGNSIAIIEVDAGP
jgi:predicted enzyme related to lactoylglutathione lyase